jgi:hypothetical protein
LEEGSEVEKKRPREEEEEEEDWYQMATQPYVPHEDFDVDLFDAPTQVDAKDSPNFEEEDDEFLFRALTDLEQSGALTPTKQVPQHVVEVHQQEMKRRKKEEDNKPDYGKAAYLIEAPLVSDEVAENNTLSEEQQRVMDVVMGGQHSVFVTGSAGTGKSYMLKELRRQLELHYGPGKVFTTATTGVAASNIGGTTIHFFSGLEVRSGSDRVQGLFCL